ncbi:site-specific integrase [Streptomyces sp. WMMC500]|uniref:tyrosine-type recombinase/integrase n=1 Tax=Streptomyces sp. WMMC500 TaxID=3015154 RepID=UPI00248BAE1E|nr:site-specific integrase [Streptomyces sp. WMMC500]WBB59340.1 site-specific integrase [Streptomyces sp. WMMC500]
MAGHIMAMVRRLDVEPTELPENAVHLHFRGRAVSAKTCKVYEDSRKAFARWLDNGACIFRDGSPKRITEYADEDVARFHRRLCTSKSETTADRYAHQVAMIAREAGKLARDLTEDDLYDHIQDRDDKNQRSRGRPLRANSVSAKLAAMRAFLRVMHLPDITRDVRAEINLTGRDEAHTPPIPKETLKFLLDCAQLDAQDSSRAVAETGKRARTMLLLGSTNGLRIHEMLHIGRESLVWRDGTAYLELRKHKSGRRLPSVYLRASAQVVADLTENYRRKEKVCLSDWTPRKAAEWLVAFAIRHGVTGLRSHMLRARFGTSLYRESGNNLVAVKEYMRHKDIGTTQRYVVIEEDDPAHAAAFSLGSDWTATPPKVPAQPARGADWRPGEVTAGKPIAKATDAA